MGPYHLAVDIDQATIVEGTLCLIPSNYTLYHIRVKTVNQMKKEWVVKRRFSEFVILDQTLRQYEYARGFHVPELPSKKIFNMTEDCINERKRSLTNYLTQLLYDSSIASSEELKKFLSPEEEKCIQWNYNGGKNMNNVMNKMDLDDLELDRPRSLEIEERVANRGSIIAAMELIERLTQDKSNAHGIYVSQGDMTRLQTLLRYGEEEFQLQGHKLNVATRELSKTLKIMEGLQQQQRFSEANSQQLQLQF